MTSPAQTLRLPSQGLPSEAALDLTAGPVAGKGGLRPMLALSGWEGPSLGQFSPPGQG